MRVFIVVLHFRFRVQVVKCLFPYLYSIADANFMSITFKKLYKNEI